jgi:hypothetical protein
MAFVLVSDCVNSIETFCWNSASIARMIQAELELLNAQYIVEQDIRFIKHLSPEIKRITHKDPEPAPALRRRSAKGILRDKERI